jgi:hypothetical protein
LFRHIGITVLGLLGVTKQKTAISVVKYRMFKRGGNPLDRLSTRLTETYCQFDCHSDTI